MKKITQQHIALIREGMEAECRPNDKRYSTAETYARKLYFDCERDVLFTPTLRVLTRCNAVQKVYETQVCDLVQYRTHTWKKRGNPHQSKELEGAQMAHFQVMCEIYAEANPSDGDEYCADLDGGAEIDMSPEDYEPNPYDGTYSEI